jgi:hypothetical protein
MRRQFSAWWLRSRSVPSALQVPGTEATSCGGRWGWRRIEIRPVAYSSPRKSSVPGIGPGGARGCLLEWRAGDDNAAARRHRGLVARTPQAFEQRVPASSVLRPMRAWHSPSATYAVPPGAVAGCSGPIRPTPPRPCACRRRSRHRGRCRRPLPWPNGPFPGRSARVNPNATHSPCRGVPDGPVPGEANRCSPSGQPRSRPCACMSPSARFH